MTTKVLTTSLLRACVAAGALILGSGAAMAQLSSLTLTAAPTSTTLRQQTR